MGHNNFTDLCVDVLFELDHVQFFSNYVVDGQYCALKFGTMSKLKLFIRWMSTRTKDIKFVLSAKHLLALTYEDFNVFRQAELIRISSEPTATPPCPNRPMTSLTRHTSGSKKRQAFISQHDDLLDEPIFESTETLLVQKKGGFFRIFTFSIFFQFS